MSQLDWSIHLWTLKLQLWRPERKLRYSKHKETYTIFIVNGVSCHTPGFRRMDWGQQPIRTRSTQTIKLYCLKQIDTDEGNWLKKLRKSNTNTFLSSLFSLCLDLSILILLSDKLGTLNLSEENKHMAKSFKHTFQTLHDTFLEIQGFERGLR